MLTAGWRAIRGASLTALASHRTPKSARPVAGGYYVGKTAGGKPASADVSPDREQVSAAQFHLVCGGQDTQAAMQNVKIKKKNGTYRFAGKGEEALLFTKTFLSEMGRSPSRASS
jgi:hypothetical protein